MDDAGRLLVQLSALTHSPQGEVDDTRFEKLLDRLTPYVTEADKIQLLISNGGLESIEKGLSLEDERVVSIAIRLVGLLASSLTPQDLPHLSTPAIIKLMEALLDTNHINVNADALIRNSCLTALTTASASSVAVNWITAAERCNRLVSFIFRSFSDSSVFVARSATQLLSELVCKGQEVEQRLIDAGLKRHIDISMTEVPKAGNASILSPPPLHHNKICLIDMALALHQRALPTTSTLDISLSSLLELLMDADRHVRSRMVEAVQIIGIRDHSQQLDSAVQSPSRMERLVYDQACKLLGSGEGDFILTGIDLVGVMHEGVSEGMLRKFFELVMGVVVPVFGKVVSIHHDDIPKTFPVTVDLPQSTLLLSVLECFKNLFANGYTNILPGSLVVDLVVFGLSGGDSHKLVYARECRPAYELAALILSRSNSLIHATNWLSHHHVQRLLHALLAGLARSWSSFSVKTVVSLLGNGKMEGKIFQEFGNQLKDSITKGFASEESESREHVVAFIGTLYKEDTSPTAVEYYLASGFYNIIFTALSDQDSSVRTSALDSLKFVCAEPSTWKKLTDTPPNVIPPFVTRFSPHANVVVPTGACEPKFLQRVVHLLYDEDPYVQRSSIALLTSWTSSEHTKTSLLLLIWDQTSGLIDGISHALHRSDWDAQVQSIHLLHAINLTLGMLSFLAVKGHTMVLDMIKNCEERVSQKGACATLNAIRTQMNNSENLNALISPPSPPYSLIPLENNSVGSLQYFKDELQSFHAHVSTLDLDLMLKALSDEHLYDEDEEEDLALRYQDIKTHDEMDCD